MFEVRINDKIEFRHIDDVENNKVFEAVSKYIDEIKTTTLDEAKLNFNTDNTKRKCEFGFDEID